LPTHRFDDEKTVTFCGWGFLCVGRARFSPSFPVVVLDKEGYLLVVVAVLRLSCCLVLCWCAGLVLIILLLV